MTSQGSRTSLTVQYMPRTTYSQQNRPIPESRTSPYSSRYSDRNSPTGYSGPNRELNSPNDNNGYTPSEVSSVTGSVSSFAMQKLPEQSRPYTSRYGGVSGDSGNYSPRVARSTASSTSYFDSDIDSVTGDTRGLHHTSNERFQGELFQPQPQPQPRTMIVEKKVRNMYGEIHPKKLPVEDLPSSSGDELDSAVSDGSIPSFADVPRAKPRASLRRKKLSEVNSAFASDDDASISSALDKNGSQPKSILKNNSTDISDAESMAAKSNFSRTSSRRSVRFQHHDKAKIPVKDSTNYDDIDKEGNNKKKKSGSADPFAHMGPVTKKTARNDPKRSSGRGSQRGSQRGRQSRSSSSDRSRAPTRNGSANRTRSLSNSGKRGSSAERNNPTENGVKSQYNNSTARTDEVRIQMPNGNINKNKVVSQSRPREGRDSQKMCKWCLIIGIPVALLVVVGIIMGVVFAN